MMERERSSCRQEYPSVFHHQRLNDAIFYTLDLPDFFMPAIGESLKKGVSVKELSETFDLDSFETVEEFTRAYESKVETDITNLMKFVGLIARMHAYINHEDNALFFPGARTVIAAGYRSRFFSDEKEDFFSANFSLSNAYLAEKQLHGDAGLYLDNSVAQLLYANQFSRNLLRYACFIPRPNKFDPFLNYDDPFYRPHDRVKTEPINITLFRMPFTFREVDPVPLMYLQVIHRLSTYLRGAETKAHRVFSKILQEIRTGPSDQVNEIPLVTKLRMDMVSVICEFSEIIETGNSRFSKSDKSLMAVPDILGES
jgi:hypothetical protein